MMQKVLNSGKEIKVLTVINIDGHDHVLCELDSPKYVDGLLVKYIVLRPNEFKEFVDMVHAQSEELKTLS